MDALTWATAPSRTGTRFGSSPLRTAARQIPGEVRNPCLPPGPAARRIPRRPGGDCFSRKEHAAMVSSPLVESRAAVALRHSPIPALRKLAIAETDEEVVIQGSVT